MAPKVNNEWRIHYELDKARAAIKTKNDLIKIQSTIIKQVHTHAARIVEHSTDLVENQWMCDRTKARLLARIKTDGERIQQSIHDGKDKLSYRTSAQYLRDQLDAGARAAEADRLVAAAAARQAKEEAAAAARDEAPPVKRTTEDVESQSTAGQGPVHGRSRAG